MTDEQAEALGRRYLKASRRPLTMTWAANVSPATHRSPDGMLWFRSCPDFRDDASRGILEGEVQDVYRDQHIAVIYDGTQTKGNDGWPRWTPGPWRVVTVSAHVTITIAAADTKPEALVAALENAP